MSNFKVGDVCVGQNLVFWPECNGMECVVLGTKRNEPVIFTRVGEKGVLPIAYRVRWANGEVSSQPPETIRLKRPPQSDFTAGDWGLCPWSPYKTKETANG